MIVRFYLGLGSDLEKLKGKMWKRRKIFLIDDFHQISSIRIRTPAIRRPISTRGEIHVYLEVIETQA